MFGCFLIALVTLAIYATINGQISGWAALGGVAGMLLCLWAGGGARGSFLVGDKGQKIGGLVLGIVCLVAGLALLFKTDIRFAILGVELKGTTCGLIAAAFGSVFTTASDALPHDE